MATNHAEFCFQTLVTPIVQGFEPYSFRLSLEPARSLSLYRPKDDKEDLGPHCYSIRNSSYSFHTRVHGDRSVSMRLAFPYECGAA